MCSVNQLDAKSELPEPGTTATQLVAVRTDAEASRSTPGTPNGMASSSCLHTVGPMGYTSGSSIEGEFGWGARGGI